MSEIEKGSLIRLLIEPRETLAVEYKSWLNLKEDKGKAKLAKAAIAIANIGGGRIVIGIRHGKPEEQDEWISEPCPPKFTTYTEDDVSAAIGKYADPVPECRLEFARHPDTSHEHAIVTIYGGQTEPVIAKKSYGTELKEHRCYIRKLGPARSQEPNTTLEWRELFRRCVLAQRETMIDPFRAILDGRVLESQTSPTEEETLNAFAALSRKRWQELVSDLPVDHLARLPKGYIEIAFSILGPVQTPSYTELRDMLRDGPAAAHGWPPFVTLGREPFTAKVVGNALEAWLGDPEGELHFADDSSLLYWRAQQDGFFYQIEGFYEPDANQRRAPGQLHYPELAIYRLAIFLQQASFLANRLGESSDLLFVCTFTGLKNRHLAGTPRRPIFLDYRCHDTSFSFAARLSQEQIRDNLPEIIYQQLKPLYERFSFFELRQDYVAGVLE